MGEKIAEKDSVLMDFVGQAEVQIKRSEDLLNRFSNSIRRFEYPHPEKGCDELKQGPPVHGDEIEGKLNFIIYNLREKNEYLQNLLNSLERIM